MSGIHLWDLEYEKEVSSERYCIACGHYFTADENEDNATSDSIEWKTGTLLNKPIEALKPVATGLNKGIIKRR
jgi:hypothetical protein